MGVSPGEISIGSWRELVKKALEQLCSYFFVTSKHYCIRTRIESVGNLQKERCNQKRIEQNEGSKYVYNKKQAADCQCLPQIETYDFLKTLSK